MTSESRTYDVKVTRDGAWWMIYVPAIDRSTQARHEAEIKPMARGLIAATLDIETDSVAVTIKS